MFFTNRKIKKSDTPVDNSPLLSSDEFYRLSIVKLIKRVVLAVLAGVFIFISLNPAFANSIRLRIMPDTSVSFNEMLKIEESVVSSSELDKILDKMPNERIDSELSRICNVMHFSYKDKSSNSSSHIFYKIFEISQLLNLRESRWIIDESEKFSKIEAWIDENEVFLSFGYPTGVWSSNSYLMNAEQIPTLSYYLQSIFHRKLIPFITERFSLPTGRIGINSLYIVRTGPDYGFTSLYGSLKDGQFGCIIPLNKRYSGAELVIVPHDDEDFDSGSELYVTPKLLKYIQSYSPSTPGNYSVAEYSKVYINEAPSIGSGIVFTSKSEVYRTPLSTGIRYYLVGSFGYGTFNACEYYFSRLDNALESEKGEL